MSNVDNGSFSLVRVKLSIIQYAKILDSEQLWTTEFSRCFGIKKLANLIEEPVLAELQNISVALRIQACLYSAHEAKYS
jgi:hypothetical protein